jgi:hypothetical protein
MPDFELSQDIKDLGVSKVSIIDDHLYIYNGNSFVDSKYNSNNLSKTFDDLRLTMFYHQDKFGDLNKIDQILFKVAKKCADLEGNKVQETSKHKNKKRCYIQKYRGDNFLAEAVLVAGKPVYALTNANNDNITLCESIEDYDAIFLPPERMSYMNRPYVFTSQDEFNNAVERVKAETIDNLYSEVKSIWKKYDFADDLEISLCAADTIFSYSQDILGMTHYLFFVGGPGSGKSNRLTIFNFLAYRNMMSTDMTAANIYRFLGAIQEGQGTICEDEADDLDEDRDRMRIYKNGYTTGYRVQRNDEPSDGLGRQQNAYCTFGFKAFAAEKLPDSLKAKGFKDRIVELKCTYGFPKYDISEVANPAGVDDFQVQLDELNDVRNRLLIFRLLHYNDKIGDLKLNIANREKQLFKPILRIFQNTTTLKDLLPVISNYVNQRRDTNASTLHAFLYRLIIDLINEKGKYELESNEIWQDVKNTLPGSDIPNKPNSYDSTEFGEISQKLIIEILMDVFKAIPPKRHGNKRRLIFDKEILARLDMIFNLAVDIKVVEGNGTDGTLGTDVGLGHYSSEQESESENTSTKDGSDTRSIP